GREPRRGGAGGGGGAPRDRRRVPPREPGGDGLLPAQEPAGGHRDARVDREADGWDEGVRGLAISHAEVLRSICADRQGGVTLVFGARFFAALRMTAKAVS